MTINVINGTNIMPIIATSHPAVIFPKQNGTIMLPPNTDTVEFTGEALAKSMKLKGLNVAQIAVAMGLDTKTIWAFLQMQPLSIPTVPVTAAT